MTTLEGDRMPFPRLVSIGVLCLLVAPCAPASSPSPSRVTAESPTGSPVPTSPSTTPAETPLSSPQASPPASARAARWLKAGDLREARNATSVVIVGTDDVLVVGSDYETSWQSACGAATDGSDSVEIGDPGAKKWRKTASLPTRREAPAVVGLRDGRVLVTGGERGENDGNVSYSSTYVFDPVS